MDTGKSLVLSNKVRTESERGSAPSTSPIHSDLNGKSREPTYFEPFLSFRHMPFPLSSIRS